MVTMYCSVSTVTASWKLEAKFAVAEATFSATCAILASYLQYVLVTPSCGGSTSNPAGWPEAFSH